MLEATLEVDPSIRVVGRARNGAELLKLNVTVNGALARIQTLTGELRAVAYQLEEKR